MTNPTAEAIAQAFTEQAFQPTFLSSTGPFIRSVMGRAREIDASHAEQAGGDWPTTPYRYDADFDDSAVDAFAAKMKLKLASARAKGRSGWDSNDECTQQDLCRMLLEHVAKGDPVDVANFCMFLSHRGQGIVSPKPGTQHPQRPEGGDALFWADRLDMLAESNGCGAMTMKTAATLLRQLSAAPAQPAVGEGEGWRSVAEEVMDWLQDMFDSPTVFLREDFAEYAGKLRAALANTAPPSRYCDACEQVVSEPCSAADCATPENLRAPSREVGDADFDAWFEKNWPNTQQRFLEAQTSATCARVIAKDAWNFAIGLSATPTQPTVQDARDGDDDLLGDCYSAMARAMSIIDADKGPGRKHSQILNSLAKCRVRIERRAESKPQQAAVEAVGYVGQNREVIFYSDTTDHDIPSGTNLYAAHPPHGLVVDEAMTQRAVSAFERSKRTNVFGKMHAALLAAIGEVKP